MLRGSYRKNGIEAKAEGEKLVQEGSSISAAARMCGVKRKTLSDYIRNRHTGKRGPAALTLEEEDTLKTYAFTMGEAGNALTRKHLLGFAAAIDAKKPAPYFGPNGPSDGWWQGFTARHPDVSLRLPGVLDGGRAVTAHQSVVTKFFKMVEEVLSAEKITEACRFFNVDETAFGDKNEAVGGHAVYRKGTKYPSQRVQNSRDHTTVTLCIRADGRVLPPCVIFKGELPQALDGPANATYASSEAGFMTAHLFLEYLKKGVEPYLDCPRPCVLFMDNASVHRSIDIASFCLDNGIIPILLPPNTTQILQPADQCFAPLKKKIADLMRTAGLLRPGISIGKSRFPIFLRHALPAISSSVVQAAWRHTGLFPLDARSIPAEKLVADVLSGPTEVHGPAVADECPLQMEVSEEPEGSASADVGVQVDVLAPPCQRDSNKTMLSSDCQTDPVTCCDTCRQYIRENPLVKMGKIPAELAHVLIVPPDMKTEQKRKTSLDRAGYILTSKAQMDKMKRETEEKCQKEEEKKKREAEREAKKQEKERQKIAKENEQRRKKAEREEKGEQKKQEAAVKKLLRQSQQKQRKNPKCGICSKIRVSGAVPNTPCMLCGQSAHASCVERAQNSFIYICVDCEMK